MKCNFFLHHPVYFTLINKHVLLFIYEGVRMTLVLSLFFTNMEYRINSRNFHPRVFFAPQFSSVLRGLSPFFSAFNSASWHGNPFISQKLTVFQEYGISAVLIRMLGLYYKAEAFHFKFMNRTVTSRNVFQKFLP
jgi:hypothetical protein